MIIVRTVCRNIKTTWLSDVPRDKILLSCFENIFKTRDETRIIKSTLRPEKFLASLRLSRKSCQNHSIRLHNMSLSMFFHRGGS